jgi:asparagine synthase (glutamine-hydrolysing)
MCGILVGYNLSEERINSIAHRGIEWSKIDASNGLSLVHHRLPIQTAVGDGWNQPLEIGNGMYLLFNGEIFNYPDQYNSDVEYLRSLFSTYTGEPEMFYALYVPHIEKWDGFWAITIVDTKRGNIIAFTDPLGKKSLYYNERGEICSEMKGLLSEKSQINEEFMGGVKKWGYIPNESTPFVGVSKLKPNYIYTWNTRTPEIKKTYGPYYSFTFDFRQFKSEDDVYNWLWDKLEISTRNRLLSLDYPISILISGGLDSTIIGGILMKMGADVSWYSINNGPDNDYVRMCEEHWGIKVNFLEYDMNSDDPSFDGKLDEIYARWNESPVDLGSVVPQYLLFDAIKKGTNTRIVLSGDGADELFGGYKRIHEYDSQKSDIFHELTHYHLPRLDKMSMAHTLELRNPFLNLEIVSFALGLKKEWRTDKKILKETFRGLIPDAIIDRKKHPLKNEKIVKTPDEYRQEALDRFREGVKKVLYLPNYRP